MLQKPNGHVQVVPRRRLDLGATMSITTYLANAGGRAPDIGQAPKDSQANILARAAAPQPATPTPICQETNLTQAQIERHQSQRMNLRQAPAPAQAQPPPHDYQGKMRKKLRK